MGKRRKASINERQNRWAENDQWDHAETNRRIQFLEMMK